MDLGDSVGECVGVCEECVKRETKRNKHLCKKQKEKFLFYAASILDSLECDGIRARHWSPHKEVK
jgi:hypothetical protein